VAVAMRSGVPRPPKLHAISLAAANSLDSKFDAAWFHFKQIKVGG
jgi:hypothetical protein